MSRIVCKTIYKFDELSDKAKEKAREWWRNDDGDNFYYSAQNVIEDAETIAKLFGLEIDRYQVPLHGGGTRYNPKISYDLYHNTVGFDGYYSYKKGSRAAVKDYAPQDEELHRIVEELQNAQANQFYKLRAKCTDHHYYGFQVEIEHDDDPYRNTGEAGKAVKGALKDFCRWILKQLKAEYEYVYSDENVDECISINEYEFNEDGSFAK